jgi:hypothetical protein
MDLIALLYSSKAAAELPHSKKDPTDRAHSNAARQTHSNVPKWNRAKPCLVFRLRATRNHLVSNLKVLL